MGWLIQFMKTTVNGVAYHSHIHQIYQTNFNQQSEVLTYRFIALVGTVYGIRLIEFMPWEAIINAYEYSSETLKNLQRAIQNLRRQVSSLRYLNK